MKTGFKDSAAIKKQTPKDKPIDGKPYPFGWDHRCPQYDQRSSNFVNVGTDYDVGIKQPVGHKGDAVMRVDRLPYGRVNTLKVDGFKVE